jgi:hypothetical protein
MSLSGNTVWDRRSIIAAIFTGVMALVLAGCSGRGEATPSEPEAPGPAASEQPLPALGGVLELFPTASPDDVVRRPPTVLTDAVSPTSDDIVAAWREFLAGARIIAAAGPRDLCVDGSYSGSLAGLGTVSGKWNLQAAPERPAEVLLEMSQAGREAADQVTLSFVGGQPKIDGARLRVVESPVCS